MRKAQIARIEKMRRQRDPKKWAETIEALREVAKTGEGNILEAAVAAARARANVALDNLVHAGFRTEGQVFGGRLNPAVAVDRRDEASPNYYLDYAFDEMRKLVDTFPKSYTERVFVVRTAIDMNVQRAAEEAVENQLRQFGRDYHATQAATVVGDLDGGVRAMVGGGDYGASQFNRATGAYRRPGPPSQP